LIVKTPTLSKVHRLTSHLMILLALALTMTRLWSQTNPRQNLEPDGRDRTFNLYLVNQTDQAQTFTVSQEGWSCCDSPLPQEVYGPVPPDGRVTVWIARVQGHGGAEKKVFTAEDQHGPTDSDRRLRSALWRRGGEPFQHGHTARTGPGEPHAPGATLIPG
jgi:hypothetical protein